jgi:hypothetical protein
MSFPSSVTRLVRRAACVSALAGTILLGGCASARGGAASGSPPATEEEWRALAAPRPAPAPGAPRIALSGVQLLAEPAWSAGSSVPVALGVAELVAAGLLRRADVRFVERRRFSSAVEAERAGRPRPPGAPVAGVSEGAELVATVVVAPVTAEQWTVEVRLSDAATGEVRSSVRALVPPRPEPVALARQGVRGILGALDQLGRLPAWTDPAPAAAPAAYTPSGVPEGALRDFLAGLAAEESWAWERARASYRSAAASVGFVEAGAALARTARLRLGGTLGES